MPQFTHSDAHPSKIAGIAGKALVVDGKARGTHATADRHHIGAVPKQHTTLQERKRPQMRQNLMGAAQSNSTPSLCHVLHIWMHMRMEGFP